MDNHNVLGYGKSTSLTLSPFGDLKNGPGGRVEVEPGPHRIPYLLST